MNLNRKLTLGSALVILVGLGMRAYVRSSRKGREAKYERMEADQRAEANRRAADIAAMKAQAAAIRTGIASCDELLALMTRLDACTALTPEVSKAFDDVTKATSSQDMDARCANTLPSLKQRAATLGCKIE